MCGGRRRQSSPPTSDRDSAPGVSSQEQLPRQILGGEKLSRQLSLQKFLKLFQRA